jgi:hypothetical protein
MTPSKYVWAIRQPVTLRLSGEVVITESLPANPRYGALPAASARTVRLDIVNRKRTTVYLDNVPTDVGQDFPKWSALYDQATDGYSPEGVTFKCVDSEDAILEIDA